MNRNRPLSAHYREWAEWFLAHGNERSAWFYLMAAEYD